MYRKNNGTWKSDFRMNGERYQHTWDTPDEKEALSLENELKSRIKLATKQYGGVSNVGLDWLLGFTTETIEQRNNTMTLSDLRDYMLEKVWNKFADPVNPVNRMNKIIEFFGDIDIRKIDVKKVDSLKTYLLDLGRAEKTVNHYLSTLNTALENVSKSGRVKFDAPVLSSLRMEESKVKRDIVYSHIDEREILRLLKNEYEVSKRQVDLEYYHFMRIMFKLGYRPSEFYALTIGDVDFNNKTVTISKGSNRGKTKNGVVRTLPIEGETLSSFKELIQLAISLRYPNLDAEGIPVGLKEILKEVLKEGAEISTSQLPSFIRKLPISGLSKYQCENCWKKVKLKMGWYGSKEYDAYNQYAVRHTIATRLASELNFGAHQIMRFMGHRNMSTSISYVHLNVDDLRDATKIGESRF